MMKFGLDTEDIRRIQSVISSFPEVENAILYGSRAKGNYREGSDIDVCLVGPRLNLSVVNLISQNIDDLLLPYFFDISIYHKLSNPSLLEHINSVGVSLF